MSIAEEVAQLIKSNFVTIFSKSYCPHCKAAKALFSQMKVATKVVELDQRDDGADVQAHLLEITKQRTVPNIFIDGKHIGGNDTVQGLYEEKKLQEMTKNAPSA